MTALLKRFGQIFLTGLVVLLPVTVTVAFMLWLLAGAENVFGDLIQPLLGERYYPGMGMLLGIAFVFTVGLLAQVYFVRKLLDWGNALVARIPLVKTVFGAVRDLVGLFHGDERRFNKVVRVRIPGTQMHLIGFVTREDFSGLPAGLAGPGMIAVWVPLSYQIGGYTLIMPRDQVEPLDMPFEDAMRFAVTAGLSSSAANDRDGPGR
jgi:uncharacterized membrane protein